MRERVRKCSASPSPTLPGCKVRGFILVTVRVLQWFVSMWTPLLGSTLWWLLLHQPRTSVGLFLYVSWDAFMSLLFLHWSSFFRALQLHFTSKFHAFHVCWFTTTLFYINPLLTRSRSAFLFVSTCHLFIVVGFPIPGLCPIFYFLRPVLLAAPSWFSTSQSSAIMPGLFFSVWLCYP